MMREHHRINAVRTTIDLDPAALSVVRELAAHRGQSLGRVASELILEAVRAEARVPLHRSARRPGGFPVVRAGAGQAPITAEVVQRALEDEV